MTTENTSADLSGGVAAPEQGPSLAESLAAAYDKAQDAPDAVEAAPVTEQPAAVAARARDEAGRFARAEQAAETAPPAEQKTSEAEPAKAPEAAPAKASAPPVSWSAAAKAKWASLDPDVQAEIAKREGDVTRGFAEKGEEAKRSAEIIAALEPVQGLLKTANIGNAEYIRNLVAADQALRGANPGVSPEQAIRHLAAMYGVNVGASTEPGPASEPQGGAEIDPHVAALRQEVAALRADAMRRQEQEQLGLRSNVQRQIDEFRNAVGADGQPLRPYYDQVEPYMIALMEAQGHRDLERAYNEAVWANPDVRASIQAQQAAEAQRKATAEAAARAKEAQRKAGLNISARGNTGGSPVAPLSIRDSLSQTYDAVTAA